MSRTVSQIHVARVAACAVGLAFAAREEHEAVDALLSMAENEMGVLAAARRQIADLKHLDEALRACAGTLLDAASTRALARRAAVAGPSSQAATPPVHSSPQGGRPTAPLSGVATTASRPPAGQEER